MTFSTTTATIRRKVTHLSDNGDQDGSAENQDRDITTAEGLYTELLRFKGGVEGAAAVIRNRGLWLEAIRHVRVTRTALEQFMSERITADIRQAHETAQLA